MKNQAKASSKRDLRNNAVIVLVAGLLILIVANLLFQRLFGRADLTEYGVNTLSEASVQAVKDLGDFEIKLYVSPDLPETLDVGNQQPLDLRGVRTRFEDKLDEYRSYSEGGMRLTHVTEDVIERAKKAKLQVFSGKKATVEEGRLKFAEYVVGATFHYKNVMETYPLAIHPEFYEYEMTKILVRLRDKAEKSLEMKDVLEAGQQIFDAAEACHKAVDGALEGTDEVRGLAALFASRQASNEKLEKLKLNAKAIHGACEPLTARVSETEALAGRDDFLARLMAMGARYVEIHGAMKAGMEATEEEAQLRAVKAAHAIREYYADLDQAHDDLKNAPGKKSVGILCGSGAFCPFPAEKPIIQPEIGQLLGQKNPFISQFIDQAKRIEEYINRVNSQINKGVFTGRGIEIKRVKSGEAIPADVEALVVFGPTRAIPEADWYRVDQFLLSGKSVVVLANQFDAAVYNMDAEQKMTDTHVTPNAGNLTQYLKAYGLTLGQDLVYDARHNDRITVTQLERQGPFTIQRQKELAYPAFPTVGADELAEGNVLVRNLPSLTLPYVSTVTVDEAASKAGKVTYTELIRSSSDATARASNLDVDPAHLFQDAATFQSNGPHGLAVLAVGEFDSYFKGAPLPEGVKDAAEDDKARLKEEFARETRLSSGKGRLLVIGTNFGLEPLNAEDVFEGFDMSKLAGQNVDFITDLKDYAKRFQNWQVALGQKASFLDGTIAFTENVFDWAIQNDALVAIRTKFYDRRPLVRLSSANQRVIQYGTIIGVPILFALLGLLRRHLRRQRIQRKVAELLARKQA
jgi:hypothetical protein